MPMSFPAASTTGTALMRLSTIVLATSRTVRLSRTEMTGETITSCAFMATSNGSSPPGDWIGKSCALVGHECRYRHGPQHLTRNATEDPFPYAGMPVSSHHQHVEAFVCGQGKDRRLNFWPFCRQLNERRRQFGPSHVL